MMRHLLPSTALAAVFLIGGAVALERRSPPAVPADDRLAALDARLRETLADAATVGVAVPDPEVQFAHLQAADAALDAMAAVPARDHADLDRKAAALLLVDRYEVQEAGRLALSLARDTLRGGP